ncbi:MAG: ABC transporter ATP-binding protein [Candidatus Omnitrophota bacterium]|jgi:iron complex transport system ATP-binding protein|nr:ABC transporter ATP-binding protein [Candidatus Omnitrophota bacterium]
MSSLVKVDNLSGGYGKHNVLEDISFDMKKGEFLGIIGPNGSGKSTLLRFLSKVLLPQKGIVSIEGKDIKDLALKEFCRSVSFVPQDTVINFSFTTWEIVMMGRIPHLKRLQNEGKRDFQIAENALLQTDSSHLKNRLIDQLSSGERQRVIIAKALTQEPTLLLLDEPTSHLDIGHQIEILDLLRKLNREKKLSIVMVLHDLNLASEYCNRIVLLKEGSVFKDGTPDEVLTYQNIENVYKTVVVVNKNPISSKPYVVLVPKEK